jgi:hypothetical protein
LPACYSAGVDNAGTSGSVMRQGGGLPGCWPTGVIGTPGGACNFVIIDRTTYCPDFYTCAGSYTENYGCSPGSGFRTDWLYCQCGNPSTEGFIY